MRRQVKAQLAFRHHELRRTVARVLCIGIRRCNDALFRKVIEPFSLCNRADPLFLPNPGSLSGIALDLILILTCLPCENLPELLEAWACCFSHTDGKLRLTFAESGCTRQTKSSYPDICRLLYTIRGSMVTQSRVAPAMFLFFNSVASRNYLNNKCFVNATA